MMPATSERIELVTPLADELLFHGLHAQEELSRLGEYHLDLLSKNKNVDRDKILGAKVSIKVMLESGKVRYFNGFVSCFSKAAGLGRYARYYAVVKPWLWFLTRTSDCRIFQDKNVKQIIEDVFADHPQLADFVFELNESYCTYKYCVQYRETDFNFVSRLLEHEGIYYYFRHTDGHHTLVMTDSVDKHDPFPGYETLKFIPPHILVKPGVEHINAWDVAREVQPGVYAHDDYDFERPSVDLTTTKTLPRTYTPSNYEVYDYPGFYMQKPHGEHYAHVRIDEFGAQFEVAQATTNYRGVSVGSMFTLEAQDQDYEHFNGKYLVIGATQSLEGTQYESIDTGGGAFRCTFTALSCDQQFRPRRVTPKPFVQGPQTAVVVGPAGDQIYTDKYGRVKVQFHWDRRGKKDENSSCWVRVSHPWAGKGWGSVATPRIGQEVIVDFLEGDPDQPIITGRVYNEENQPPFGFPAGAVISGVKSDTHKGAGYNEMSLDDTAGKERVFIHGQYNMDTVVEHDQTSTVHNCRTDRIDVDDSESIGNNQKWDVGGNRDATIHKSETLHVVANRTKSIDGNETTTVKGHRSETVNSGEDVTVTVSRVHTVNGFQNTTITAAENHAVGAARTHEVGLAEMITVGKAQMIQIGTLQTIDVGGAQNVAITGPQDVKIGKTQTLDVGADQMVKIKAKAGLEVGGDQSIKVEGARAADIAKDDSINVGQNFLIEAKDSITLASGKAQITLKKDGTIEIKGKDITIEGSGKITVDASSDVIVKGSNVGMN
jgi:type VI secretion system secreted protein VgrG